MIVSVSFQLRKIPVFNTTYGAIETELKNMGITKPSIRSISEAVCNIRRSKLPDPVIIGNAGSFFKNPEIDKGKFESLKTEYPSTVGYETTVDKMKLAAGWLIEQCGWKGKRIGDAGVHNNQALVLVNYGNANGNEIASLAREIQNSVEDKFGVELETEVNII